VSTSAKLVSDSGNINIVTLHGAQTCPHGCVVAFGEYHGEFCFGYGAQDGSDVVDIFYLSATLFNIFLGNGGDKHAVFFIEN